MGQGNKMLGFIVTILVTFGNIPSIGQNVITPNDEIQLGTVWFNGKSTKLTNEARSALDTIIKQILTNPTLQVKIVSYNKDFCDKCSKRSWKRTSLIVKYISKYGISEERLLSENRLEGEMNKVDIVLISSISGSSLKGKKKQNAN